MSAYEHIHPDFWPVMAMSDEARIDFMYEPRWIGYGAADRLIVDLEAKMRRPGRPRQISMLVVGDSNNGKTTIIRRFQSLYGKGFVDEEQMTPNKPVILIESPPSADEKGLYVAILEQFFAPYRHHDPCTKLRMQVLHMMRECHVRMLIIDEFHSLLTGTTHKQRELMNALRNLCNELAIPVVGVGTKDAMRVLHSDPQYASRFDVVKLQTWELNKSFQGLLKSFEKILPLKKPSQIYMPELATKIHAISGGNLGNVHRLLIESATMAIQEKTEHIDMAILERNKWVTPTAGIREVVL